MKKKAYIAFCEVVIFYGGLTALNWFLFPHLLGFLDVDPHPFWLGILLFGFRYGVATGLTSGLCSTGLYIAATWLSGEQYRLEELNYYILPSFFIIFGVLVGVFSARSRTKIAQLTGTVNRHQEEKGLLTDEISTLTEINRGLERRIVTRMSTLITLYEGARKLEAVHLEDLYPAVTQFVAKTLSADATAIYLRVEEGWKQAYSHGWKAHERYPPLLKNNEGLTGIAGASGKIVSIRDFIDKSRTMDSLPDVMGDAMLAGPIRKGRTGEVIGVLSIQRMPFENFSSASISLFAFLLEWVSRAVAHAYYIRELTEREILDPVLTVYSPRYFHRRMQQEFDRSQKYYLPLSVGAVHVPNLDLLSRGKKLALMQHLSQLLNESTRDMDVVARGGDDVFPFTLLWITTSDKQAVKLREAIMTNFAKFDFSELDAAIDLQIGVASFTPTSESAEALLASAKQAIAS